jgi:hypothetical protein
VNIAHRSWRDVLAVAVLAAVAALYVYWGYWLPLRHGAVLPNHDAYTYFYPNLLYLIEALESHSGLLWNRLQNCGQPAFGNSALGALYPLYVVFFLFGPDYGQFVLAGLHFLVAGAGTYLLCRELRLTPAASLSGALAVELGAVTAYLTSWNPTIIASYAWLPAAVWGGECVLRRQRVPWAIVLGVVLGLQLLPGYPQIPFFTYQIIAFRVAWEVLTNRDLPRLRVVGLIVLGFVLGPCLVALQYVPAWEFAQQSVRGGSLSPEELRPPNAMPWDAFFANLRLRDGLGRMLSVVTASFALVGITLPRRRRIALCYAAILVISVVLAFDNPVFDLYRRLPLASTFRLPHRFLWVTGFAVCVLVAFGVDASLARDAERRRRTLPWLAACVAAAGVFYFTARSLTGSELALMAAILVLATLAFFVPRGAWIASVLIPCVVLWGSLEEGRWVKYGFLENTSTFRAHAEDFRRIEERMTLEDRIYHFGRHGDMTMVAKTATLFSVPSIIDYEPQTSRRYADLFVWLLSGRPMRNINHFNIRMTFVPRNRPLLNLLAARYLIVDKRPPFSGPTDPPLKLLGSKGSLRTFENTAALPRAFYVPRAAVISNPNEILRRLASESHDPRRVALIEEPPPGVPIPAGVQGTGVVKIVYDYSEIVGITVRATEAGYLVLTDQYYPGWEARVNGVPARIARANYAFRLVRVPRGESIVVFRYRPRSLRIGLAISLLTGLLLLGYVGLRLRKRI